MLKWTIAASILAASAILAVSLEADEAVPATAPSAQSPSEQTSVPVKTGKERLGDKASDEQRVDEVLTLATESAVKHGWPPVYDRKTLDEYLGR